MKSTFKEIMGWDSSNVVKFDLQVVGMILQVVETSKWWE